MWLFLNAFRNALIMEFTVFSWNWIMQPLFYEHFQSILISAFKSNLCQNLNLWLVIQLSQYRKYHKLRSLYQYYLNWSWQFDIFVSTRWHGWWDQIFVFYRSFNEIFGGSRSIIYFTYNILFTRFSSSIMLFKVPEVWKECDKHSLQGCDFPECPFYFFK